MDKGTECLLFLKHLVHSKTTGRYSSTPSGYYGAIRLTVQQVLLKTDFVIDSLELGQFSYASDIDIVELANFNRDLKKKQMKVMKTYLNNTCYKLTSGYYEFQRLLFSTRQRC